MTVDLVLTCKIQKIYDLEVFSSGDKKVSIEVMAIHRRKVETFEISFYNKYIPQIEKLNLFGIYKIGCILRSEIFVDQKTEERSYFTHLVGIYVIKIGNT